MVLMMAKLIETGARLRVRGENPRRNLPKNVSLKRGESNFLRAFERSYLDSLKERGVVMLDFALSGFGVPDLLWIAWSHHRHGGGTALSIEGLRERLQKRRLVAFEMKLKDWRRALMQAHRYRYFSDKAVVVLPEKVADLAQQGMDLFRQLEVGLWSFDPKSGRIQMRFDPKGTRARNITAREKAIDGILSQVQFRLLSKQLNPFA